MDPKTQAFLTALNPSRFAPGEHMPVPPIRDATNPDQEMSDEQLGIPTNIPDNDPYRAGLREVFKDSENDQNMDQPADDTVTGGSASPANAMRAAIDPNPAPQNEDIPAENWHMGVLADKSHQMGDASPIDPLIAKMVSGTASREDKLKFYDMLGTKL